MQWPAGWSKRPSSEAAARSATRRIMSVTFADGCELVSAQCLGGESYFLPYVESLSDARTKLGEKRVSARLGWGG